MSANARNTLLHLARVLHESPAATFVLGYLAARADRVHFCRSVTGASVACVLAAHGRLAVPMLPFQGWVRGVPIPDPVAWVEAADDEDEDIYLQIATDDPRLARFLEPLMEDQPAFMERVMADRLDQVKGRLDSALDIYNLCRQLVEEEPERSAELRAFLDMARQDVERLAHQLNDLTRQMDGDAQA